MLYPIIGFFSGFILGLIVVKHLLRGKSKEELRTDKGLHKKYGSLVWLFAILGTVLGIMVKPFFL